MKDIDVPTSITIVLIAILVIVFFPFVTIWSLNTLFSLDIPYTLSTWFATAWITLLVTSPIKRG